MRRGAMAFAAGAAVAIALWYVAFLAPCGAIGSLALGKQLDASAWRSALVGGRAFALGGIAAAAVHALLDAVSLGSIIRSFAALTIGLAVGGAILGASLAKHRAPG